MWLISRLCCIMLDIVDHSVFRGLILIVWQQQCSDHTLECYFNLSAAFPACQWQNIWKIGGLTARNTSFFINPGTPVRTHTAVLVVARRAVHLEIRLKPKKWNLSFGCSQRKRKIMPEPLHKHKQRFYKSKVPTTTKSGIKKKILLALRSAHSLSAGLNRHCLYARGHLLYNTMLNCSLFYDAHMWSSIGSVIMWLNGKHAIIEITLFVSSGFKWQQTRPSPIYSPMQMFPFPCWFSTFKN